MQKLLIYQDNSSHKFWRINVTGNCFTVTYGKIGTIGAIQSKQFDSPQKCEKEANKLINSKLKKGYIITDNTEEIVKESTITEDTFWNLLDSAKKKGDDPEEQIEWLISHLSRKPIKDIIEFDFILQNYHHSSYTSDLWAAAYIIMGGCSDDSFDYFRAWLIFQGKDIFNVTLRDPQAIIPALQLIEDGEVPELEDLLFVASSAYEEKTGLDDEQYNNLYLQTKDGPCSFPDIEFDWDENDEEGLKNKFPKLWELYGDEPLG